MDLRATKAVAKYTVANPERSCHWLSLQSKLPLAVPSHIQMKRLNRKFAVKAASSGDSQNRSGRSSMVDADMLVLRRRIHQLRMSEINYAPPEQWMEWEKRWYASYDSDVCACLLWLQSMLHNTRPGMAVGVLALITLSIPASALLLIMELLANMNS